ncbi:MAG TPA: D-alanyl-D-alanine carboxypeptidase/D-alanyl-D-alanine-endopeptidase [Sunxiuqinia sp.]|nr:D-alanyl-D-alanine carboxypeptidase/D-alanyl-D-alanine-endopeptidase [Sunxiuqinia sp.]
MKKVTVYLLTICLVTVSGIALSQEKHTLQDDVNLWINDPALEHASIGIYMLDADHGKVLAETSPQLSLVPGSILKLLTTSTALDMLGADYRFKTRVAYSGEIRNDTLVGNLYVIGGGDPALGSKYFKDHYLKNNFLDQWVNAIQQLHIKYITGNLITDATIFEDQLIPNTWIWEDLGNYYGAGACGLSVYDDMYKIHFSSPQEAGQPTKVEYTNPFIPELKLNNQVTSSDINRDEAYVFGAPTENTRVIRGTIPKDRTDYVVKASIPNPPYLLAWQLTSRLQDANISMAGMIKSRKYKETLPKLHPITKTVSPPLIDLIRVTNHESVNLFAEHLLKYLSFLMDGQGSTKGGIKVVTDFWQQRGIDMDGLFMADGSGLSRFNSVTPKEIVEVLNYMKNKSPNGNDFFSSLAYVPNGTLHYFNPVNFPGTTLRAKSGSMTRVRCFAGQLITKRHQTILFSIMLNNFSCSQHKAIKLAEELLVDASND